jgi:hypothetical protein
VTKKMRNALSVEVVSISSPAKGICVLWLPSFRLFGGHMQRSFRWGFAGLMTFPLSRLLSQLLAFWGMGGDIVTAENRNAFGKVSGRLLNRQFYSDMKKNIKDLKPSTSASLINSDQSRSTVSMRQYEPGVLSRLSWLLECNRSIHSGKIQKRMPTFLSVAQGIFLCWHF